MCDKTRVSYFVNCGSIECKHRINFAYQSADGLQSRIVASILFEEVSPSEVAFWAYSKACFGSETMRSLDKILKCRI